VGPCLGPMESGAAAAGTMAETMNDASGNDASGTGRLEIAIIVQDEAWKEHIAGLETMARRSIEAGLQGAARRDPWHTAGGPLEVSLVFADDDAVAALNKGYRGREGPTNVLSFPNMDGDPVVGGPDMEGPAPAGQDPAAATPPRLLGDIVLARETVLREAAEQRKSVTDHSAHLLVHGFLHLLGYDHTTDAEADAMESLEVSVLAALGVADPYNPADNPADPFEPSPDGAGRGPKGEDVPGHSVSGGGS